MANTCSRITAPVTTVVTCSPRIVTSGQRFELRAWANTKLSEKSKLGAIVMACGFDLPKAGEEFDLEELLGSVVEGLVEHVERERGTFVSVSKFRPRRSNSGSAPRIGSDRSDPFSDE